MQNKKFKTLCEYLNMEYGSKKTIIKYSFFYTFLLGLLAHAFGFFNLYPSHDSLVAFFYNDGLAGGQMSLGRVLQPLYHKLTASNVLLPWSAGIFSLIWIALSVYLVSVIFHLKNNWQIFLIAGIFVTNRTITALIATYEYDFGADMLGLLFAVLSVFFWYNFLQKGQFLYLSMGAISLVFSMGLYQSYIAVTITLIILHSVISLLENTDVKTVFKNGLFGIFMIICGGILYYFFMKVICRINNIQLSEGGYNSVTNLWSNTEPFLDRIRYCYKQVFSYFSDNAVSLYSSGVMLWINILLALACIYMLFEIITDKRIKWLEIVMVIILVILLPIGTNITRLMNSSVHDLMVYAVWIVYMFPILLWKLYSKIKKDKGGGTGLICCMLLIVIIYNNIQTANAVYVDKKFEYDSTISVMTNVLYDIERQEDYTEGETPVVFIGTPGDYLSVLPLKDKVSNITGSGSNSPVTYSYGYLFALMERKINLQSAGELENSEFVKNMPSYPKNGSITQLNGTVIVKFKKQA